MHCVQASHIDVFSHVHMSPALNGRSGIQRFEHSDVIEIRDEIMFIFYPYPGLPPVGIITRTRPLVELQNVHVVVNVR